MQRFVEKMVLWGRIRSSAATGVTVITICNYEEIAGDGRSVATLLSTETPQERYKSATESKKVKKAKKIESISPSKRVHTQVDEVSKLNSVQEAKAPLPSTEASHGKVVALPDRRADSLTEAEAVDLWNVMARSVGLPTFRLLKGSTQARRQLRNVLEEYGHDGWQAALAKVAASDNLCGRDSRGFQASFLYLVRPDNFANVMGGASDNRPAPAARRSIQAEAIMSHRPPNVASLFDDGPPIIDASLDEQSYSSEFKELMALRAAAKGSVA